MPTVDFLSSNCCSYLDKEWHSQRDFFKRGSAQPTAVHTTPYSELSTNIFRLANVAMWGGMVQLCSFFDREKPEGFWEKDQTTSRSKTSFTTSII